MTRQYHPRLLYVISTPDLLLAEVVHAPGHLPGEAQDVLPSDLVLGNQALVHVEVTWQYKHNDMDTILSLILADEEDICALLLCMKLLRELYWANSMISKMGPRNKYFDRFIEVSISNKENAFPLVIHTPQTLQSYTS